MTSSRRPTSLFAMPAGIAAIAILLLFIASSCNRDGAMKSGSYNAVDKKSSKIVDSLHLSFCTSNFIQVAMCIGVLKFFVSR